MKSFMFYPMRMGFIRIFPLTEPVPVDASIFGTGEPARCVREKGPGSLDYFLNTDRIAAFEECPLYLTIDGNPNHLTDGIRIKLTDNSLLVIADESEDPSLKFAELLKEAMQGKIAEMDG